MGIKLSPIYLFSDQAVEGVVSLPLFEIHFIPFSIDITAFDSLIFTSKNSVKALINHGCQWQTKECYAIGEGTAKAIKDAGGNVTFTCKESYGDIFAHEIAPKVKHKKVFFPRAKEVVSPLYEILCERGIAITQEIVYETVCLSYTSDMAPPQGALLIFTSPSTVHCFMKNFPLDSSYQLIAIGKKTAAVLPLHVKVLLPEKQTIPSCIALAKQIRSKNYL
jgi:uroporphyrinogen-III synthase